MGGLFLYKKQVEIILANDLRGSFIFQTICSFDVDNVRNNKQHHPNSASRIFATEKDVHILGIFWWDDPFSPDCLNRAFVNDQVDQAVGNSFGWRHKKVTVCILLNTIQRLTRTLSKLCVQTIF